MLESLFNKVTGHQVRCSLIEAAFGGFLGKSYSLKISQYLQAIFTPVLESLFNEVAGLQTCNVIKKRLQHRCFLVNIANILRTPILKNTCELLLLVFVLGKI